MEKNWDVIVVGGGFAGLSAALMLGRARRRVLVLDAGEPRNRFAAHMHGVLGNEGADPLDLLRNARAEVAGYGVEVRRGRVENITPAPDAGPAPSDEIPAELAVTFSVAGTAPALDADLPDGPVGPVGPDGAEDSGSGGRETHTARAVIVATGITDDLPKIPGLADQWGAGVLHCPYCHGWEVRDRRLGVLATGAQSIHQAELVRQWSADVVLFAAEVGELSEESAARLRARGVRIVNEPVVEVLTDDARLVGVRLADGTSVPLDAIFTVPRAIPHDEFISDLALERVESPAGSLLSVDPIGATSHPRIWAVGNVVQPFANVPLSVGAGSLTGGVVNMALVSDEYDHAVVRAANRTVFTSASGRQADDVPDEVTADVPDDAPPEVAAGAADSGPNESESALADHWEDLYTSAGQRWSGRVNEALAQVAGALSPGKALDLGCGEGGDAIWLAQQGWRVTAVDISPTAMARAARAAEVASVGDRVTWINRDLTTWVPEAGYDLVAASYFHSAIDIERTAILRRAAGSVRSGGYLLVISHVFETDEDIPPWAWRHREQHGDAQHGQPHAGGPTGHPELLTPEREIEALGLNPDVWRAVIAEIRRRRATSPDGDETAMVKDGIVLLRRTR